MKDISFDRFSFDWIRNRNPDEAGGEALIFVLFGTLTYKNGQNWAFWGQKALKTDAPFASILGPFQGSFSLIYQAVTPHTITVRKFYCQIHKKNLPAPEKISRGSSKNFSVFHEKFWPVSRDHLARHFKVIWPVPRFAFVPKWTKLQAREFGQ